MDFIEGMTILVDLVVMHEAAAIAYTCICMKQH